MINTNTIQSRRFESSFLSTTGPKWVSASATLARDDYQKFGSYFSVTGQSGLFDLCNDTQMAASSYGSIHDDISKAIPYLRKYLKWHLCNLQSGPFGYVPIAMRLLGLSHDNRMPIESAVLINLQTFKNCIVFGSVADDEQRLEHLLAELVKYDDDYAVKYSLVYNYLMRRLPLLMKAFHNDMAELFGLDD